MPIGTRYRNNISKSSQLNNTRRSVLDLDTDKGGIVIKASNITFTSTDTITSDDASFPVVKPDVVTNGAFAADTDWTKGSGWAIGTGVATATTSSAALSQSIATLTAGKTYWLTYTTTRSAGSVQPSLGGTNGTSRSTAATFTELIACGSSNTTLAFTGTGFSGTIDNVSLEEVIVQAGQLIEVSGSALNSRTWEVVTASPAGFTVNPAQIQSESTGVDIDIRTV